MPPQTGTALVLLVAFVLPGFVTVLIQERTYASSKDPTPLDRLLRVVYYSVWCYLLLAAGALIFDVDRGNVENLDERFDDEPAVVVMAGALAILIPAALVATTARIWDGSWLQAGLYQLLRINPRHEVPTAWDDFFRRRPAGFVRVTFQNGAQVGGWYGEASFAAYARDGRDLYLEQRWTLEGDNRWFTSAATDSLGIWISTEDAVSIEFYNRPPNDVQSDSAEANAAKASGREGSHATERGAAA